MRSIEVDFDVHRAIENERRGFDELPNAALRRLLGLAASSAADVGSGTPLPTAADGGRPWIGEGVTLPHGTRVRFTYSGRRYEGEIADGFWLVDGERGTSPSGAASAVARTKANKPTNLDGWKYWQAMRPGDEEWTSISELRPHSPPA